MMRLPSENAMVPERYVVRRVRRETYDTYSLELKPHDGWATRPSGPGQFNMLYCFGVGEIPISISGDVSKRDSLVHTVRAVGAVSRAICRSKPGDIIGVRGPFGAAWPVTEAERKDVVLAAGGLGLAPLRPVLYHLLANRERYGKIALLYGARTPADLLYRRELEKWRGSFGLQVKVTVDHADRNWYGNVGVVTKLLPRVRFEPLHTVAMVCGPEIMMRFMVMELHKFRVPDDHVYVSMERNMKCGIGHCGHCQMGPKFICKDGPVFNYREIDDLFGKREI